MNPHDFKIVVFFASFQFMYTVFFLMFPFIMFNYEIINAIYLVLITGAAILNGGSYYIQIFSQRYNSKFKPKDKPE